MAVTFHLHYENIDHAMYFPKFDLIVLFPSDANLMCVWVRERERCVFFFHCCCSQINSEMPHVEGMCNFLCLNQSGVKYTKFIGVGC